MSFRSARIASGKTVVEVSEELGVSRIAVYAWEDGQYAPKLDKLQKLAKLYGCTIDELLRKEEE